MIERSWLVGLCALLVYAALASPCIVAADNAEFATLGALGGAAHPSGYPAYVLWLRAWSWLPAANAAHAASLATAILGGLAIGVLHAACRAWGARPIAATIAVAIVGAAPIVLQYHTEAEVFAGNGLVAALVLWLSAAAGPLRGRSRAAALGVVAGLGLACHLSCALLAPIGLYGVVRGARESNPASYALAAAGFALGLLPYGYLLVADGPASWGTVSTLGELWATIQRREYGGLELVPGGAAVPWTASVAALAATVGRSWLWLPALAGVAMLAVRIWRPAGDSRWAWALLAASIALAGPILVSRFNIDPHGIGLYICRRFHVLPTLLLAVPVAAALDVLCARLTRSLPARTERSPEHRAPARGSGNSDASGRAEYDVLGGRMKYGLPAGALAIAGFGALVALDLPGLWRVHSPAMERGVHNLLGSLPPAAVAVVISEDQCFGGHYLQLARGERPDVALVCSELLRRDWYRARWAGRGLALPADPRGSGASLGEALLRSGRPIFVDRGLADLIAAFPSYPFGVLYRVLPRGTAPPAPHAIADDNRDLYQRFDLSYPRPGRDDDFAAVAHRRYTATWAAIAQLLDAAGDHETAREAVELARQLQPAQD